MKAFEGGAACYILSLLVEVQSRLPETPLDIHPALFTAPHHRNDNSQLLILTPNESIVRVNSRFAYSSCPIFIFTSCLDFAAA
eukprot:CAMPEP_0184731678 /NCGR_PEP_ID=MMETSP0314-20130426/51616_1 /TAXON_ID=38298 /ORGANISM="Rhodella maculata, Strain CCMP 736" /LENGTH=82 /DNA_ID=CAMNT_0027198107 /DNA_START=33 /DNA_END=279 /DNA_ORIENTATION=+